MKVTIVGAGNVGATAADCLARTNLLKELVLVDIAQGVPQGKALDMQQSSAIHGFDTHIIGTNDYEATANSDVCIITAGLPRKPGMSRDDLVATNAKIVKEVTKNLVAKSPNTIIIVVSNPLDAMSYVSYVTSGFDPNRVIGMAGVLDTARYRTFIAREVKASINDVQAVLLGGHGDDMVPLPRFTTVWNKPITDILDTNRLDQIVERTKTGGGEIVKLMGTSAWYAPGASAAQMCEAILKDSHQVLPCSIWLTGQYGLNDVFVGVPVRLGRKGVEEVIDLKLNPQELALLQESADHVREIIEVVKKLG